MKKIYYLYIKFIKKIKRTQFVRFWNFLYAVKILEQNSDIREIYSKNFKYILVDEYQDTNFIQSKWLHLLAEKNNNLCCVGDDDQSL